MSNVQPAKALPIPSSSISESGLQKAVRWLGKLEEVTPNTRLVASADALRIIAGVEERLKPCSRNEAATLVANLIGAYPDVLMMRDDPDTSKDFKLYTLKLHEAFSQFSFAVGMAICNGGTGLPSQNPYKPKPADVVAFGKREVDRLINTKTMAQRHLKEAERRREAKAKQAVFEQRRPPAEERQRQVQDALARFRDSLVDKAKSVW